MKTDEIIDFYFEATQIREIGRYSHLQDRFRNNVAEHCFHMTILADKLIEHYKLDLDFRKVVRYIYLHDWGEIGLKQDIVAFAKQQGNNHEIESQKEFERAKKSLSKFGLEQDISDLVDYDNLATEEAKFAMAVDKLECCLFIAKHGLDNIIDSCIVDGKFENSAYDCIESFVDFEVNYPNRAIKLYPPLKDFAEAIMERLKAQAAKYKK